jgi:hypothetical protein
MILHMLTMSAALASSAPAAKPAPEPPPLLLPAEGRRCELPGGRHFTWRFASRPRLGTVVLKVQVFGADGKRVKDLKVAGRSGMPSMRGAHDTGDTPFKLNKKGDYLLPVDVVMPGGWEVVLSFFEGRKRIYHGKVDFEL